MGISSQRWIVLSTGNQSRPILYFTVDKAIGRKVETMAKAKDNNVEFLESFRNELIRTYQIVSELCPSDFAPVPDDPLPTKDEKAERVARLADENGFDGSLFRNSTTFDDPTSLLSMRLLGKQNETIYKIIAAIDKPRIEG